MTEVKMKRKEKKHEEDKGVTKARGKIKSITISAIHIKADGTRIDKGVISRTEVK